MTRLEMKNYNIILTEKSQKYQHYDQVNMIKMRKNHPLVKVELQNKLILLILLCKNLQNKKIEDQRRKQVKALRTLKHDTQKLSVKDELLTSLVVPISNIKY